MGRWAAQASDDRIHRSFGWLEVGDGQIDIRHVQFFHIPTNEPWCRDHGPIFIRNDAEQKIAIVDWDYNAWGGKYPPFDLDEIVPTRIGEQLGLPVHYPRLIMEGGSIDPNP